MASFIVGALLAVAVFVFLCALGILSERANRQSSGLWILLSISGFFSILCGYYFVPDKTNSEPETQAEAPANDQPNNNFSPPDASREEMDEVVATLLNLGGHLCARVVSVTPLRLKDTYEVTCIEYRGGNGRVTYIFEATSGNAFRQ
jgi:hypothetical protein